MILPRSRGVVFCDKVSQPHWNYRYIHWISQTAYLGYCRKLFRRAGLNAYGAKQGVSAMLKKENTTKGVIIRQDGDELIVDLHITVNYGINVGAIVDSIIHKVNYVLTEQAGVNVKSVNVYVDEMKG